MSRNRGCLRKDLWGWSVFSRTQSLSAEQVQQMVQEQVETKLEEARHVQLPKLNLAKLVDWLGFPVQFQSSPSLVTNIWKKPVVFALKWVQFNPFQL